VRVFWETFKERFEGSRFFFDADNFSECTVANRVQAALWAVRTGVVDLETE
jgi:hypothetical protein